MYLQTRNHAYSIGPHPVQKLWDAGWRVGLWRRICGICILSYAAPIEPIHAADGE